MGGLNGCCYERGRMRKCLNTNGCISGWLVRDTPLSYALCIFQYGLIYRGNCNLLLISWIQFTRHLITIIPSFDIVQIHLDRHPNANAMLMANAPHRQQPTGQNSDPPVAGRTRHPPAAQVDALRAERHFPVPGAAAVVVPAPAVSPAPACESFAVAVGNTQGMPKLPPSLR